MEWIRCASIKTNKIYYVFMCKEDVQSQIQGKMDRISTLQYKNSLYYIISSDNSDRKLARGVSMSEYDSTNDFINIFINSQAYGYNTTTILVKNTPIDNNMQDMSDNDPFMVLLKKEIKSR